MARYRIEVRSGFLPRIGTALGDFDVESVDGETVASVEVADRAQLRKLIRRVEEIGAEILRLRRLAPEQEDLRADSAR